MDTSIFEKGKVYNKSRGEGVIVSVTPTDNCDCYINVQFDRDPDNTPCSFLASVAIKKQVLVFHTNALKNSMSLLLTEIEMNKSLAKESNKPTPFAISNNEITNKLITKVGSSQSIALDLISLYEDTAYEEELYSEAFKYLERHMKGHNLREAYQICILVALALIALKYYDGDLHSYIESNFRRICVDTESDYPYTRIQKSVYDILRPYREMVQYFDPKSYVAVPIIMGCAPHYRMYDLFRLSYDIYKKKLLYDEDISDDQIIVKVRETLLALKRKDLISDSDVIKGTNYLMSKYTQSCIYSGVEMDSLVLIIAHCIRLIIKSLTMPEDSFPIEPYYSQGFEAWKSRFDKDTKEKEKYLQSQALSRPYFRLINKRIYIVTGELIMDDSFDPNDVFIKVFANGELVEEIPIDDPNAIEYTDENDALGGYKIRRRKFEVSSNPLNNISYSIVCGETEIYNSRKRLFRRVLFFDGKGVEVKPGTERIGEIFVVSRTTNSEEYGNKIHLYATCRDYYISSITVNNSDVYTFDEEPFVFYKIHEARFMGYSVPWAEFETVEGKKFDIFTTAIVLFEAPCEKQELILELDGEKYTYGIKKDLHYSIRLFSSRYDGNQAYTIKFFNLEAGYHRMRIINSYTGKTIKGTNMDFIYDPDFRKEFFSSTTRSFLYELSGAFVESQVIEYEYNDSYKSLKAFVKNIGYGQILIYPSSICYSADDEKWFDVDTKFYLCDVDDSTKDLLLCGPRGMKAYYYDRDEAVTVKEANLRLCDDCSTKYALSLDYLRSQMNKTSQKICFTYGNRSRFLLVGFVPFIVKEECCFKYNKEDNTYCFTVVFEGTSDIQIGIFDWNSDTEVFRGPIHSNETIEIKDDQIPKNVKFLRVAAYGKKSSGLFSSYRQEPFLYFPKFKLKRNEFKVDDERTIVLYEQKEGLIKASISFEGIKEATVVLSPTGRAFNKIIYARTVCSGEQINFDIGLFPFNSYTLSVYSPEDYEESGTNATFKYLKNLPVVSPVLKRKFRIKNFITKTGDRIPSSYSIYFAMIEEYKGLYCSVCKMFDNSRGIELLDVLVFIERISGNEIVASMRMKTDNGLTRLKLKNGQVISGLIIDRLGE